jgi:hypothetical protein
MEFPSMVYKVPGKHVRPHGTYDFAGVNNAEELQAKLKEGWFSSLSEAIELKKVEPVVKEAKVEAKVDDIAPPTRLELEEKATELGIKFDGRFSDKKISQLIDETLTK